MHLYLEETEGNHSSKVEFRGEWQREGKEAELGYTWFLVQIREFIFYSHKDPYEYV